MATMIEVHCKAILDELKSGKRYTRRELEFLLKFFSKIAETTKKMLEGE